MLKVSSPGTEVKTTPETYYQVLGVASTATPTEITEAYQRLIAATDSAAQENKASNSEQLSLVQQAYALLQNQDARNLYDQFLAQRQVPRAPAEWQQRLDQLLATSRAKPSVKESYQLELCRKSPQFAVLRWDTRNESLSFAQWRELAATNAELARKIASDNSYLSLLGRTSTDELFQLAKQEFFCKPILQCKAAEHLSGEHLHQLIVHHNSPEVEGLIRTDPELNKKLTAYQETLTSGYWEKLSPETIRTRIREIGYKRAQLFENLKKLPWQVMVAVFQDRDSRADFYLSTNVLIHRWFEIIEVHPEFAVEFFKTITIPQDEKFFEACSALIKKPIPYKVKEAATNFILRYLNNDNARHHLSGKTLLLLDSNFLLEQGTDGQTIPWVPSEVCSCVRATLAAYKALTNSKTAQDFEEHLQDASLTFDELTEVLKNLPKGLVTDIFRNPSRRWYLESRWVELAWENTTLALALCEDPNNLDPDCIYDLALQQREACIRILPMKIAVSLSGEELAKLIDTHGPEIRLLIEASPELNEALRAHTQLTRLFIDTHLIAGKPPLHHCHVLGEAYLSINALEEARGFFKQAIAEGSSASLHALLDLGVQTQNQADVLFCLQYCDDPAQPLYQPATAVRCYEYLQANSPAEQQIRYKYHLACYYSEGLVGVTQNAARAKTLCDDALKISPQILSEVIAQRISKRASNKAQVEKLVIQDPGIQAFERGKAYYPLYLVYKALSLLELAWTAYQIFFYGQLSIKSSSTVIEYAIIFEDTHPLELYTSALPASSSLPETKEGVQPFQPELSPTQTRTVAVLSYLVGGVNQMANASVKESVPLDISHFAQTRVDSLLEPYRNTGSSTLSSTAQPLCKAILDIRGIERLLSAETWMLLLETWWGESLFEKEHPHEWSVVRQAALGDELFAADWNPSKAIEQAQDFLGHAPGWSRAEHIYLGLTIKHTGGIYTWRTNCKYHSSSYELFCYCLQETLTLNAQLPAQVLLSKLKDIYDFFAGKDQSNLSVEIVQAYRKILSSKSSISTTLWQQAEVLGKSFFG